ncbi:MAG: nucleotidyltransferase domain-containing protein [Bacteroidetes bacterium]|nr:nucleotidyltransferase domain-containing protein [Bacteroidota bacterium]MDA1121705.1 nucleotidyltransferase domain-containing protein [Bacteroidota bacterium]
MNRVLQDNIEKIKGICREREVRQLFAFGSVLSKDFHSSSDVDFLIAFKDIDPVSYSDNFFIIHKQLEDLLKRKIDLITERSLHNPYFIESINRSKQLIYEG